ncbi:unnamed protein product [Ixodes persulcatus]
MFRPKWALWKLNNNLFKNKDFNERLITCFMAIRSDTDLFSFAQWDSFKQEAKNIAIECACIQTYNEKADRRALTHSLHELNALECEKPRNLHEEICFLKSELERHELQRYRGAAVRSRCQRLVSAEQPTKKNLDDERRHALAKEIPELLCTGCLLKKYRQHYDHIHTTLSKLIWSGLPLIKRRVYASRFTAAQLE